MYVGISSGISITTKDGFREVNEEEDGGQDGEEPVLFGTED